MHALVIQPRNEDQSYFPGWENISTVGLKAFTSSGYLNLHGRTVRPLLGHCQTGHVVASSWQPEGFFRLRVRVGVRVSYQLPVKSGPWPVAHRSTVGSGRVVAFTVQRVREDEPRDGVPSQLTGKRERRIEVGLQYSRSGLSRCTSLYIPVAMVPMKTPGFNNFSRVFKCMSLSLPVTPLSHIYAA